MKHAEHFYIRDFSIGERVNDAQHLHYYIRYLLNISQKHKNALSKCNYLALSDEENNLECLSFGKLSMSREKTAEKLEQMFSSNGDTSELRMDLVYFEIKPSCIPEDFEMELFEELLNITEKFLNKERNGHNFLYVLHLNQDMPHFHVLYFSGKPDPLDKKENLQEDYVYPSDLSDVILKITNTMINIADKMKTIENRLDMIEKAYRQDNSEFVREAFDFRDVSERLSFLENIIGSQKKSVFYLWCVNILLFIAIIMLLVK